MIPTVILVFEGADRCGKTSLATRVAQSLRSSYYHFGKPDSGLQAIYGRQYQYHLSILDLDQSEDSDFSYNKYGFNTVVLDRSWLSGLFYTLHRRQDSPREEYLSAAKLVNTMAALGMHIEYFFVSRNWDRKLSMEHIDEIQNSQNPSPDNMCERLIEHYSWPEFVKNCPLSSNVYHTVNYDDPDYTHERILEYLNRLSESMQPDGLPRIRTMGPKSHCPTASDYFRYFWAKFDWFSSEAFRSFPRTWCKPCDC
jgi:hypothetical protein